MRILVIDFVGKGGMAHYACNLCNALLKKAEIFLLCPREAGKMSFLGNAYLLDILELPSYKNLLPKNLSFIRKMVESVNPDIIHYVSTSFLRLYFLLLFSSYPSLLVIHDPMRHRGDEKGIRGLLLRLSDRLEFRFAKNFVVHGETLKRELVKAGAKPKSVHVVPIGDFSHPNRHYPLSQEEKSTLLFFGRIREYKGLGYLLDAIDYIWEEMPDVRLIVAGEGDVSSHEERLKDKRITVLDRYIEEKEIPELFWKSSLVVLPYKDASQSGIIPLAHAYSKPVVVTDVGSLPEMVEDGITGLIVPPCDSKAIAHACLRLLRDDFLRKEMGKRGKEKLENEFSSEKVAERHLAMYRHILEKKVTSQNPHRFSRIWV